MAPSLSHARVPNTCQYTAHTNRGDYLIQVAWPLSWSEDRIPPENDGPISTVYLVDGNVFFFTAVDVTRRLEFTDDTSTVVVGVGYPNTKCVYDFRRGPDLTPASTDGTYEMPLDSQGNPRTDISFGKANEFLDFIQNDVMADVQEALFPHANLDTGRKALFGHSYGGIFVLNTLYTRPTLFNTFIAGSPEIWWNNSSLVKEQEAAFRGREQPVNPAPSLLVTWGSGQQDLERRPDETEKAFANRLDNAEDEKMRDSGLALVKRLENCPSLRSIWTWEFKGEDHGSAAVTGLQQGIIKFVVDKY